MTEGIKEYLERCKRLTDDISRGTDTIQPTFMWSGEPGRCFRNTLLFVRQNPHWTIVHGVAEQPSPSGLKFGHAWAELYWEPEGMWVAYCPTQSAKSPYYQLIVPRDHYYGGCKISYLKRYTLERAELLGLRHDSCGPFDEKINVNISLSLRNRE